jgi:hypothetical protein
MIDLKEPPKDGAPIEEVQLIPPKNAAPNPNWYAVVALPEKVSARVKGPDGVIILIHRSRIAKVRALGSQESGTTPDKEEVVSETAASTTAPVAEKPKAAKTAKDKKKKEIVPFDLDTFVKENGGVHLTKQSKFDHASIKCFSHCVIDAKKGLWYNFNTYKYPTGIHSLGKGGKGIVKNALKGARFVLNNKPVKGTMTSAELAALRVKNGYKLVSGEMPKDAQPENKKKDAPAPATAEAKS